MDWLIPGSPDELASMVAGRADREGPLLATGAPGPTGTARRRPEAEGATVFSTSGLEGALDLRARDLTVAADAGTRIADLQRALAEEDLWLAIGGPSLDRSVGGAVAAASPGPWDRSYGDLARQLLSCRVVTWRGTRARWGRAVMKDVAGYGTTRPAAGSFGRLGVLHRAAFRVWPAPEASAALELTSREGDPLAAAGRLAASDFGARARPDALRWSRSPAPGRGEGRLEAWLIGSSASVQARRARLEETAAEHGIEAGEVRTGLDPSEAAPGAAGGERPIGVGVAVLRPGRRAFEPTARRAAEALGEAGTAVAGYPLRGVLRCTYRRAEASTPPEPLGRLLAAVGDVPVRIERGSAGELAAARARRPQGARRLERRVLEALEGRPRHWLSGYL